MPNFTRSNINLFGAIVLGLTTTFGSMPARATLVSYNLIYTGGGIQNSAGRTDLDVTIFFDNAPVTSTFTGNILLSSAEVNFRVFGTAGASDNFIDGFKLYENTATGPRTDLSRGNFVPYGAAFFKGTLLGIVGVQPGGIGFAMRQLAFSAFNAKGTAATVNYFTFSTAPDGGSNLTEVSRFNLDRDFIGITSVTGPNLLVAPVPEPVPEPGTLALFGIGLVRLGYMRRRRRASA